MTRRIDDPVALAHVWWRTPEHGGRRTGPPPGPFFAATAVFVHGEDEQVLPDWPAAAEHFSVILEYVGDVVSNEVDAKIDFIARDLVGDELRPNARFLVMEGSRPVAEGRVTEVFADRASTAGS